MDRWAEGTSLRVGNALAQKCRYYGINAAQRTARSPKGKQDLQLIFKQTETERETDRPLGRCFLKVLTLNS